jgi:hypothetical protein
MSQRLFLEDPVDQGCPETTPHVPADDSRSDSPGHASTDAEVQILVARQRVPEINDSQPQSRPVRRKRPRPADIDARKRWKRHEVVELMKMYLDQHRVERLLLNKKTEMMRVHIRVEAIWIQVHPADRDIVSPTKLETKFNRELKRFRQWNSLAHKSGADYDLPAGRVKTSEEQESREKLADPTCAWVYNEGIGDVELYQELFSTEHPIGQYVRRPGDGSDVEFDPSEGHNSDGGVEEVFQISQDDNLDVLVSDNALSVPATPGSQNITPARLTPSVASSRTDDSSFLRPSKRGKVMTTAEGTVYLGQSIQQAANRLGRPEGSEDVERATKDVEALYGDALDDQQLFDVICKLGEKQGGQLRAVIWNSIARKGIKDRFINNLLGEEVIR